MLGKRTQPMIGKISELLVSGNRVAFLDVVTSPKSPLELKIQSPRGVKNYDLGGGVGLGIVAALDKSGGDVGGSEILARYAMSSPRPIRAVPIPVINVKNCYRACYEEPEMRASFERSSYSSYMTCHGPKNESFSRTRGEHGRKKSKNVSIFCVSPARCPEDTMAFPVSDFLSSCHLCRKKLHGKDIYMYRGEKAFCSTECRERQIMIDDRKEQCRSEATRSSVDVSSSPYAQGNIFATGILAI